MTDDIRSGADEKKRSDKDATAEQLKASPEAVEGAKAEQRAGEEGAQASDHQKTLADDAAAKHAHAEDAQVNTPASEAELTKAQQAPPSEERPRTTADARMPPQPGADAARETIAQIKAQTKAQTAKPAPAKPSNTTGGRKSGKTWWWLGATVLLLIVLAGLSVFLFIETRDLARSQKQQIDAMSQELISLQSSTRESISALTNDTAATRDAAASLKATQSGYADRLSDLESRSSAQAKRLLAMSDTSRDDWLLAEAEYLLKLANQRIRIERSAEGSEALLVEADAILRDLEDPSLHNLRRAIAKDLAALRLMTKIDVEGIYLALVALAEKTDVLPLRADIITRPKEALTTSAGEMDEGKDLTAWQRVKQSFQSFIAAFDSYISIESHSEKPQVLAPDSAVYIRQNLRLMLERAQLALLREQQDIYRQSIDQAQQWASLYYPNSQPRTRFIETLDDLKEKNIVSELPDISESLNLLHEHIKNIHLLKGAQRTQPADAQQELG